MVRRPRRRSAVAERVRVLLDNPLTSYLLVLGATLLLLVLGLVMVFSASVVASLKDDGSQYASVVRQGVWAAIGLPAMLIAARMPVRFWRIIALPALLGAIALLVLVLVPGIGVEVNGNRNWIDFGGPFRLQPSEAAKLALALFAADVMARKRRQLDTWRHLLVPVLPVALLLIALVLLEKDLGTVVVLVLITGTVLYVVGAPLRLFAVLGVGAAGMIAFYSLSAQHRMERFHAWLHPDTADALNSGFQSLHGRYALGSGGFWGLGLGAGREKWGSLPEAHTDFILAVIGEELGLVGTLTVLMLFAVIGYAGVRIALRSNDIFVTVAASGITAWVIGQALINFGAVTGLLPIAGLPLPLISYGGSALLVTLVAMGVLLSLARAEPGAREALTIRRTSRRGRWERTLGRASRS